MSKARLVITAVVEQHRPVPEVAASYSVARSWVYELLARWRVEGEAAFEPRSRRPHTSPNAASEQAVAAVLAERDRLVACGHDAGPETIHWHLKQSGMTPPSRASIARILTTHGRVVPAPKKKPKTAYHRFAAEQPNECWQSDFTHYRLANGLDVESTTWLDDHSRMALHICAHPRVTGPVVLTTFRATIAQFGCPAATLTDNGMVYTVRHSAWGVRGGRNAFETELATLGIVQKNGRGNHPQTQGKVERFQQTLKTWLTRQTPQLATLTDLQALLDTFRDQYNHDRAPPSTGPTHPRRGLHRPTQSHPRHRPPRPDPHAGADRQGQQRQDHPAPRRHPLLHRHRPLPQRKTRHSPHPRPQHHHQRRHHRRNPAQPHPRHHPPLPTPETATGRTLRVRPVRDVLRHHIRG